MEETITILIYIHAFLGGIGLLTGTGSAIVKKGGKSHKKMGTVFSYAMIASSLISLVIARMPNHENLFLFLIGIFTIYMVLAGNRALTFKNKRKEKADILDLTISGIMLTASIGMFAIGLIGLFQKNETSILYLFFGVFGALLTIKDFQMFMSFSQNKNMWLKNHLGRMIGALIASFTAFLVAGLHISTLFVWLAPTILGTLYIVYWKRKLKVKPVAKRNGHQ
ncbi:hypothetical protein [uncultured Kriegella sp.]|uniref:hypothetical protein n=1 Tax=uncultured Kriegella sp. TaxID=1798910 RepID=UPI0030D9A3C3|tara:strand:- start:106410 stop:107078 length:669 start_codon:yes stop_codon:yes gene_type:complete